MVRRDAEDRTGSRWFQNTKPLSGLGKPEIEAGSQALCIARIQLLDPCELNGVKTMTFVKNFLRDESGASAAEYALILAVVGAGIAFAAFSLGGAISTSIGEAQTEVETCSAGDASGCTA